MAAPYLSDADNTTHNGITISEEMSLPRSATAVPGWPFDNSYARLPDRFYARLGPTPVPAPRLIKLNRQLALQLGLDPQALASPDGVATP